MPDLRERIDTTQLLNDRPKAEAPITEVNV
jgi:hypothetical protein